MPETLEDHTVISTPDFAGVKEWFAVRSKPRHEKKVASDLEEKQIEVFLPLYTAVQQWSDRKQQVQLPLFPGYVFIRIWPDRKTRTIILQTNGVQSFVGLRGTGISIPEEEVQSVRSLLAQRVPFLTQPFLSVGQKVRIRGGSLDGVNGVLVSATEGRRLVVSIECIQRSLAISIDGYQVEAA